jgi:hypothetical protein
VTDRYGSDVLASDPHRRAPVPEVAAEAALVVECARTGWCGAVVGIERTVDGSAVVLEDRHGVRRTFSMMPAAFLLDGAAVTLVSPAAASRAQAPARSASGSVYVEGLRARTARAGRLWVEGKHDAELVEKVWGHDLRVEGIVVEPLHGADHIVDAVQEFGPGPQRRLGVLLDHLVPGTKEQRLADQVHRRFAPHVQVLGHPYVDVWQAVKPSAVGIAAWPAVPRGTDWKSGVMAGLGWPDDVPAAWSRILGSVRSYADLEPSMLARVEQLVDLLTA